MSQQLTIEVDPISLETSASGAVTGRLRFSTGGQYFPDDSWNDFVVVVLGWWCKAVIRALQQPGQALDFELRFMDGPFSARVRSIGETRKLTIAFLRNGKRYAADESATTKDDLQLQILEASKLVLSYCQGRGVSGLDVESLKKGTLALESL